MKFYLVQFTHKASQKHFFKFGVTNHTDVVHRFKSEYDLRYNEFYIKPLFSLRCSELQANELEKMFLKSNPKNFNLEYLVNQVESYYNKFSGITECFVAEGEYIKTLLSKLYRIKSKLTSKE